MAGLLDSLVAVHDLLEDRGILHALCGGLAANLYRTEPRATTDVDLSIIVSPTRLQALVQTFRAAGWQAEPYWRKAELLRLSRPDAPRVDCLFASTDYERVAVQRAPETVIEGKRMRVLTREDLIISKLIAGRARDYEAVAAILNAGGPAVDEAYIIGWLEQFGLGDRWPRALEEAKREAEERG